MKRLVPAGLLALAVATTLGGADAPAPKLNLPLACEVGRTCEVQHYVDRDPGPGAVDYRCGHRTYQGHSGTDIRLLDMAQQRRGVAVLAAAAGRVARLRDGVPDISARDPAAPDSAGRECGNAVVVDHGGGWETQYCHLARGSVRVKVGEAVKAGQPIARVGLSGQTEFAHLHLTVRQGSRNVDPFAPDASAGQCVAGAGLAASMWTPAAQRALAYRRGVILNAGFAAAPVNLPQIEAGGIAPPDPNSAAMVIYMRAAGLEQGDVLSLSLKAPDGQVIVADQRPPLERDKAQVSAIVGRKRPPAGWPKGRYVGTLQVIRGGKPVLAREVAVTL
jgi:murein DD-endopeptidase MepM/ murein hydrolase activator NlpD